MRHPALFVMSERTETPVDSITAPDTTEVDVGSTREYTFESVRSVSGIVRSTLGPCGKEKMIKQPDGSVLITGDGSTILDEMAIKEPAAALIVGAADAVEKRYHDGTTTAIILGAALVGEAETLVDKGVHPNAVISGYERAEAIARRELDSIAEPVGPGRSALEHVARTVIAGGNTDGNAGDLAELVVDAIELVRRGGTADPDYVRIVTQSGHPTAASEVVEGVALRDDPVRQAMPSSVKDATVFLTRDSVQLDDTEMDGTVSIEDVASFDRFVDGEAEEIRGMVRSIVDMGANAVLCSASIADEAQSALGVNDVLGVRRVDEEGLRAAAAVLDGTVVSSVMDATAADLGAGRIARDEDDELFVVTGDGERRATVLLRGPTHEVLAERERHARAAIEAVASDVDEPIVPGGGATEMEVARRVRSAAPGIGGREQLAIGAFADALEEVVSVLAGNAGRDPLDTLLAIKRAHANSDNRVGIDSEGVLRDMVDAGVIERVGTKRQVIGSATAAAQTVLRVDDVFLVGDLSDDE